jgi:hypothetical protein
VVKELQESREFRARAEQQLIQQEMHKISSDTANYPLFEEVKEQMADALEKGRADNFAEAYDFVVYRNQELRSRHLASVAGTNQQQAAAQRQQSIAAAVAPKQASTVAPNANPAGDSTEDVVRAAWNQALNGNRA